MTPWAAAYGWRIGATTGALVGTRNLIVLHSHPALSSDGSTRKATSLFVVPINYRRLQAFDAESGLWLGQYDFSTDQCTGGVPLPPGAAPWGVRVDATAKRLVVVDGGTGFLYAIDLTRAPVGGLPACVILQASKYLTPSSKPHLLAIDETNGDVYVALVGSPTGLARYIKVA